ncbi:MAG: hypothetical protein ABEJ57_08295 [Halobacteriaceae archaeon]
MQRRTLLRSGAMASATLATGCIAGVTPSWVADRVREDSPALTVTLASTGPATGSATVTVRHVQTPRCRFTTPPCASPTAIDRLHEVTATVPAGADRIWQIPIEVTAAVDTYVVEAETDADTAAITFVDRDDRSLLGDDATPDLTVPPTDGDTATATIAGPLTLEVTVAAQS